MQHPSDAFDNGAPLTKAQARALRRQQRKDGSTSGARPLEAKTQTQKTYIRYLYEGSSVFAVGSAGGGKTYIPARIAIKFLMEGKVERIVIARPTVSKPKHALGFLPGDLAGKLKPWLIPIMDGFKAEVSANTIDDWKMQGKIEFLSFEHMRGRTLDNAFIILDEAQNCDFSDLQLFLTRIGEGSQVAVTGDIDQIDIHDSGLAEIVKLAEDDPEIPMKVVRFSDDDVVRSLLAKAWVKAFRRRKESRTEVAQERRNEGTSQPFLDDAPAFMNNGRRMSSNQDK